MRTPCKYAHESRYDRYVDGKERTVVRTECWATKEPFECSDGCREKCGDYEPLSNNNAELSWIETGLSDELYGPLYKCARCGRCSIGKCNYCYNCGYEYKHWKQPIIYDF